MTPLNSRNLQAFMAIAEELSFRRAAERVLIDQSALSRRVQNLEESLGYPLLFRTTREVVLTEAGRVFYEEIAPAMQSLGRAADVALELRYFRTKAQKLAISRGDIDAGFMLGPFQNPQFDQLNVTAEALVALIPEHNPLAAQDRVTLADLAAQKLILGSHDQWDFFRMLIGDLFSAEGLATDVAYEPSNSLGIMGLVAHGLGVSIYAESIRRFQPQGMVFRPIAD